MNEIRKFSLQVEESNMARNTVIIKIMISIIILPIIRNVKFPPLGKEKEF